MRLRRWTCVGILLATSVAIGDESRTWNVRDHIPVDRFVIQSHRGAGELEAENTLPAFELAWSLGTIPEADLRMTKDGVIAAFHDANFRRLVKGATPEFAKLGVKDLAWDDLRKLDVGAWKGEKFAGRRVARIADVFAAMTGRAERKLYLDIKDIDLKKLSTEVRSARVESQVILASTHYEIVRDWKALVPESGTLLWMGGTEEALEKRLTELRRGRFAGVTQLQVHVRTTPSGDLNPSQAFLTKVGKELRSHSILFQTLPWGSTDPQLYWRLLDLGVASFATDHPVVTVDAVRKYYERKR